jgi:hypothetical protein
MEAIRSSETSVLIRATRCHLPEDDNHHSHRRGNLKSDNIKIDLKEIGWDGGDWIDLAQDRDQWRALVKAIMNLRVP